MKDHQKLNKLQSSFACVLFYSMKSDGKISGQEREKFNEFFIHEFSQDAEAVEALFHNASFECDLDEHIDKLKAGFADEVRLKAKFMGFLNSCICSDGIDEGEYPFFAEVTKKLF